MATKKRQMQAWIDARQRHRLSHAQVQMAHELGMNPAKLGKLDNHDHSRIECVKGQAGKAILERMGGPVTAPVADALSIRTYRRLLRDHRKYRWPESCV